MKGRFTVNPFKELDLTAADVEGLRELVVNKLQSTLDEYEKLLRSGSMKVDQNKWKPVKHKDDTVVYSDRHFSSTSSTSGPRYPALLMVGRQTAVLEDLMFGVCNPTLEIMRIKASYVDDMSGAAVLATLAEPTYDDPFQSLVVKWMELDIPFHSTNLVSNRDYIYVEATGMVRMSNGERAGYHILHSVNFPETHELPHRVRASMSVCGIFRQLRDSRLETYATGLLDPGGDMIRSFVISSMSNTFMSSLKYADCGQMRKLAWMLDKRYADSKGHGTPNPERVCVTCSAPITGRKLGDFGKSSSSCRLCFGYVCGGCKIQKKLSFTSADLLLSQRNVTFCAVCLKATMRMSASDVARALLVQRTHGHLAADAHLHAVSDATTLSQASFVSN